MPSGTTQESKQQQSANNSDNKKENIDLTTILSHPTTSRIKTPTTITEEAFPSDINKPEFVDTATRFTGGVESDMDQYERNLELPQGYTPDMEIGELHDPKAKKDDFTVSMPK